MLKKTAAMAVLVLMITSLFSGSLGRVQADAPVNNHVARHTLDFRTAALSAMSAGKVVSSGTFGAAGGMAADSPSARIESGDIPAGAAGMARFTHDFRLTALLALQADKAASFVTFGAAGAVAADKPQVRFEAGSPEAGIGFEGIPAEAGMIVTGHVSSDGPGQAYTAMVIYMNESGMKMPVFGPGMFWSENGTPGTVSHKISRHTFEPGSLSINGKIAMFKTGSARPDMYDLQWENKQVVQFGEKMSPAIFSAHMVIPSADGSEVMPMPPWPFPGEYVLDSDVVVDMANLTLTRSQAAQDSLYDNEIDAGETRWHRADISSAVKSVNVDLKWRNGSNPLKLTIYTPDGHILGPYDDSSDGKTDGRINLNVDNPSGVAAGEWSLKVTDTGVNGTGAYYVKTY